MGRIIDYLGHLTLSKVTNTCFVLLLILFIIFPFQFQFIKLGFVLIIILFNFLNHKIKFSGFTLIWNILFILFNTTYLLFGIIRHNPGPQYYIATYILWPILFTILSGSSSEVNFYQFTRIIRWCVLIIVAEGIISFFYFNMFLIPEGRLFNFTAAIRPGFPVIAISSPSVTGFIFWYFYLFALFLIDRRNRQLVDKLILFGGIVFIFATSRRVLFLCFSLAFIIIPFFSYFDKQDRNKNIKFISKISSYIISFTAICFVILLATGVLELDSLFDFFEKTSEASDDERYRQIVSLKNGLFQKPILGWGTGINADVVRSDIPGTYELSYHAKLFETGMIGFFLYINFYLVLFFKTIKCLNAYYINHKYIIAILVSVTILMVCNATNPYLGAFDYLWFTYMPFIIINLTSRYEIKRKSYC